MVGEVKGGGPRPPIDVSAPASKPVSSEADARAAIASIRSTPPSDAELTAVRTRYNLPTR